MTKQAEPEKTVTLTFDEFENALLKVSRCLTIEQKRVQEELEKAFTQYGRALLYAKHNLNEPSVQVRRELVDNPSAQLNLLNSISKAIQQSIFYSIEKYST